MVWRLSVGLLLALSGCALAVEGPASESVPVGERTTCERQQWVHVPLVIPFAPDEAELPADDTVLPELVATLETRPDVFAVRVEGHHDDCSTEQADILPAEARARSVARALAEMGVDAERLETVGVGRAARTCCSGPSDPERDARVEFSLLVCALPR